MGTKCTCGAAFVLVQATCPAAFAAPFYTASADLIFQGDRIESASASGAQPQSVSVEGRSSNGVNAGFASASAGRGRVVSQGSAASNGGKVTAAAQARAVYDDIVFTYTGLDDAPVFVERAALNLNVEMTQTAAGPLGTLGGFNARQLIWSASFMGVGASGRVTYDVTGNTGQDMLGSQKIVVDWIPIDVPVAIVLDLFAGTQATRREASVVQTTVYAIITPGGAGAAAMRGSFAANLDDSRVFGPRVFDLPEGFTVNSASMGIVDNRWVETPSVPVPEPSTWALMALGLGLVAACKLRPAATGVRAA
jgi:hypothetical protein